MPAREDAGGSDAMRRTTRAEATQMAVRALTNRGAPNSTAVIQAQHLVEADMRGHASHGLRRMPVLTGRISAGLIDPSARPRLEWTAQATLVVDGNCALGPVIAYHALAALTERVGATGIAIAAMHRTHHLGMLSPYVEQAARDGLIALVLSSTEGLVHPWGGAGALLGTNPLGVGIPAAGGDLVLDMSTGSVSAGKVLDYAARGEALPPGWAVDENGHPTTDASRAASGAISPFGGAKGYALGITLGALVGALTGTAFGPEVRGTLDTTSPTTKGDVMIVIDPSRFGGRAAAEELTAYFDQIRASGVDGHRVTIPGDRARAHRARAEEEGFEISADVWQTLEDLAADATNGDSE